MKTIGLLDGTGWSSTIGYYQALNEIVTKRLGGYLQVKAAVDYALTAIDNTICSD